MNRRATRPSELDMKTRARIPCLVLGAAALGLLVASTTWNAAVSPPVALAQVSRGSRAPELGLADINGRALRLADLRGKVVVVDFWASWCAPCRESFPFWNRLQRQYGSQGLVVVGVSVDRELSNVRTFLRRNPASFRVVHDGGHAIADRYRPSTMPSTFLVDKRGVVRLVHRGFRASDTRTLETQIQALLR